MGRLSGIKIWDYKRENLENKGKQEVNVEESSKGTGLRGPVLPDMMKIITPEENFNQITDVKENTEEQKQAIFGKGVIEFRSTRNYNKAVNDEPHNSELESNEDDATPDLLVGMKCHSGPKDSTRGFSKRRYKVPSQILATTGEFITFAL
ncbi:hypothetical protein TNCV_4003761 [Trichonephila clavipes]|nr:hypothetical protein TNCV_4003761 [Trichonephila clavipes]